MLTGDDESRVVWLVMLALAPAVLAAPSSAVLLVQLLIAHTS